MDKYQYLPNKQPIWEINAKPIIHNLLRLLGYLYLNGVSIIGLQTEYKQGEKSKASWSSLEYIIDNLCRDSNELGLQ